MKNFLKNLWKGFKKEDDAKLSETPDNSEIIRIYRMLRDENLIPADEPNYTLARKVFLDFNEFNLRNLSIQRMYLEFIPKSLLPYPKNYIKCAYYLLLDSLEKDRNLEMFKDVQRTGLVLFYEYPDYEKYKENLKHKSWFDDQIFKDSNPSPRELFKKRYGVYQISKEEYDASPSSIDATEEKLIYDFGILPEIEEDVDFDKIRAARGPSTA